MQIGEVSERTGLTHRTLRFYEEKGLLTPPSRLDGFRLYSEEDIQRIEQIVQLKNLLGFSLADIKEMLDAENDLAQIETVLQQKESLVSMKLKRALEALRLIDLATEHGIRRILLASSVTKNMSLDEQRAAAAKGAFIEHTLAAFTHTTPVPKTHYYVERDYASLDEGMDAGSAAGVRGVAEQIQAIGAEHCIIASDFGVYTLPPPVEGLREFIACLLDLGIGEREIRTMVATCDAGFPVRRAARSGSRPASFSRRR